MLYTSVSNLEFGIPQAQIIKNAHLIIIDEISRLSKYALNAIDEVLRRCMQNYRLFGGKNILLGGYFIQAPTIVMNGAKSDIIEASIKSSHLWKHCKRFTLMLI